MLGNIETLAEVTMQLLNTAQHELLQFEESLGLPTDKGFPNCLRPSELPGVHAPHLQLSQSSGFLQGGQLLIRISQSS